MQEELHDLRTHSRITTIHIPEDFADNEYDPVGFAENVLLPELGECFLRYHPIVQQYIMHAFENGGIREDTINEFIEDIESGIVEFDFRIDEQYEPPIDDDMLTEVEIEAYDGLLFKDKQHIIRQGLHPRNEPPPRYVPELSIIPPTTRWTRQPPQLSMSPAVAQRGQSQPQLSMTPAVAQWTRPPPHRVDSGIGTAEEPPKQPKPQRKPPRPPKKPPKKNPKESGGPPDHFVNFPIPAMPKYVLGYRSQRKNAFIADALNIPLNARATYPQNVNYYNIKESKKRWHLKAAYPLGTWLMDIVFATQNIKYLVLVEACSRYIIAEIINEIEEATKIVIPGNKGFTSPESFMDAFQRLIEKYPELTGTFPNSSKPRVATIQSDADPAWTSRKVQKFLLDGFGRKVWRSVMRTKPMEYPAFMELENLKIKAEPNHSSLAILDRAVRTIRDVAFNLRIDRLTPNEMQRVLEQINNAPNSSLRKLLGFDVSPKMAVDDYDLQMEILRRLTTWNELIYASDGFMLPPGSLVQIYNQPSPHLKRRELVKPGVYKVEEFNGAYFTVRNVDEPHKVLRVQRWGLIPMRKRSNVKIM